MLTALGRSHEIKGHVRGAINNGASTKEIQETLLHAAIYCGMPLAIDAFRSAHETLLELGCLNIEEASANADGGPKI
jgi:4-carboxymuconolactone decarboxylase